MTVHSLYSGGFLCPGSRFRIHILLIPITLAAAMGGYGPLFLVSWLSALGHELAHIQAARRLAIPVAGISLLPFGVCARLKTSIVEEPTHEILMALAGPAFSLALALGLFLAYQKFPISLLHYAAAANLALAALNLLPCLPLDGGRVLRAMLTLGSDALTAWRITLRVSRLATLFLLAASAWLLLTSAFNFSLILIGAFLLGNLYSEERSLSRQAVWELLYYKDKLGPERLHRTKFFSARQDLPARRLLRKLSYHQYCIIKVIDDDGKIVKTLTEGEILTALLRRGIRISLGEI